MLGPSRFGPPSDVASGRSSPAHPTSGLSSEVFCLLGALLSGKARAKFLSSTFFLPFMIETSCWSLLLTCFAK